MTWSRKSSNLNFCAKMQLAFWILETEMLQFCMILLKKIAIYDLKLLPKNPMKWQFLTILSAKIQKLPLEIVNLTYLKQKLAISEAFLEFVVFRPKTTNWHTVCPKEDRHGATKTLNMTRLNLPNVTKSRSQDTHTV